MPGGLFLYRHDPCIVNVKWMIPAVISKNRNTLVAIYYVGSISNYDFIFEFGTIIHKNGKQP